MCIDTNIYQLDLHSRNTVLDLHRTQAHLNDISLKTKSTFVSKTSHTRQRVCDECC